MTDEEKIEAWRLDIIEKLKDENLTSEQRIAYKDALIKRASLDDINRRVEEKIKRAEALEQRAEAFEQRAEELMQKAEKLEQQRISAMIHLLQEELVSEEDIAKIFDVDIEYLQQLKKTIRKLKNPYQSVKSAKSAFPSR